MRNKGMKHFFSLVIVFAMMFSMIMPVGVAYGAGVISTTSTILKGAVDPSIVVTLGGDTFAAAGVSDDTANWTINVGTTTLVVGSITRNNDTQVTITFTGTAVGGSISVTANAAALTGGVISNTINVVVPEISTLSTIANGTMNPSINVTLVAGDTFSAAGTSELPDSWTINAGTTGLTVNTISRTGNNAATINFTGKALAGTISVQAKAAALTSGVASNSIEVVVPAVTITGPATIANAAVAPSIEITIANSTFKAAEAASTVNWAINTGTTGLTVNTISVTGATATISFTGKAAAGTIAVQARAAAITSGVDSNSINVVVPAIVTLSTTSTVTFAAVAPSIVITLANDIFKAEAANTANWTINTGTTGLTVSTITKTDDTHATIAFNGTAIAGTVAVKANAGALNGGVASDSINVVVLGAITFTSDVEDNATGVPKNQIITLTTNVPSTIVGTIKLEDITDSGTPVEVPLKPINPIGNEIACVPVELLEGGKTYRLTVPGGALKDSGGNPNAPFTLTFATVYNFNELLSNPAALNDLLKVHSPRGLNVHVPKKYMTKFDITYSTIPNTTLPPLTNVDITAEAEVHKINVKFGPDGPIYSAVKGTTVWNTGYQGTLTTLDDKGKPVGQDIVFEAFDQEDRSLEKKTIKLKIKGNKEDLSSAKSLTVPRTFADLLLNNGKYLTAILKQYYTLEDLTLSVAPAPTPAP